MATLTTRLSSLSLNPVQRQFPKNAAGSCSRSSWTRTILPIECAKHPRKKCTAHHVKSRPKKHNPYDKNRKGPTFYPPLEKPPPIMGYDTPEAMAAVLAQGASEAN